MSTFFEKPILNSPYAYPAQHWELDETGQPTNRIIANRRLAEFIPPIPKPKEQKKGQKELVFNEGEGLSSEQQQYALIAAAINALRQADMRNTLVDEPLTDVAAYQMTEARRRASLNDLQSGRHM